MHSRQLSIKHYRNSVMTSPRAKINGIRDFERFLKKRGFTGEEAKVIAVGGWKLLLTKQRGNSAGEQDNKSAT